MQLDIDSASPADIYKVLVNTVTPRPIAWVVTQSEDGTPNCAPHSFFNVACGNPPILMFGCGALAGRDKDTARLVRETGEFVIAMVGEADAEAMNVTAVEAPPGVNELALARVPTMPASLVKPPLIASAPVNFECRTFQLIDMPTGATIVLGSVVAIHVDDRFVYHDEGKLRIDNAAMKLVARTHGTDGYIRSSDAFALKRLSWPIDGTD